MTHAFSDDPIWTLSTGSFFLIRSSAENFFQSNFLTFQVMLHDRVNVNETIGSVDIAKSELLNAKGDRIVYELTPKLARKSTSTNDVKGVGSTGRFARFMDTKMQQLPGILGTSFRNNRKVRVKKQFCEMVKQERFMPSFIGCDWCFVDAI